MVLKVRCISDCTNSQLCNSLSASTRKFNGLQSGFSPVYLLHAIVDAIVIAIASTIVEPEAFAFCGHPLVVCYVPQVQNIFSMFTDGTFSLLVSAATTTLRSHLYLVRRFYSFLPPCVLFVNTRYRL